MGSKDKTPDDIELFRREMADVRRLKFEERVQARPPRTERKVASTTGKSNDPAKKGALRKGPCPFYPDKKVFESLEEATSAAHYVKQEWRNSVRPYQCPWCDRYHLTSK